MKASKQELFFANTNTNSHSIPARCLLLKFLDVLILVNIACLFNHSWNFLVVTWLKMIGGPLNVLFAVRKTAGKKKKPQKSCFQSFFFFFLSYSTTVDIQPQEQSI